MYQLPFEASIFSNQLRTGNFLGLERSERKHLFFTQLFSLERLRLISATARGLADQAGQVVLTLEGERKGITQLLSPAFQVESIDELAQRLESLPAHRLAELSRIASIEPPGSDLAHVATMLSVLSGWQATCSKEHDKDKGD